MSDVVLIDAHHHLWDPESRCYPWMADDPLAPIRRRYGVDDLRAVASAAGVDRTVLVQTVSDVTETEDFLTVAATSGGLVAGVVGWVDLPASSVSDDLARLAEVPGGDHLVGVRHQVQDEPDPRWLERSDVSRGLAAVGAAGLVYDLLVFAGGIPTCAAVADAHHGMTFVLDHGGKPPIAGGDLDRWSADIAELARRDNVVVKLSGLVTEADWRSWSLDDLTPVVEQLLSAFGPERMMFGSDWPVCELAASYGAVMATARSLLVDLSAAEHAAVFGDTALRVYGLSPV